MTDFEHFDDGIRTLASLLATESTVYCPFTLFVHCSSGCRFSRRLYLYFEYFTTDCLAIRGLS